MIESENLILRPIEEEDLIKIQAWKNDRSIKKFVGGFSFGCSKGDISEWFKRKSANEYKWAIETKKEHILIGFNGLYEIDFINRNAEWAFIIGEKEFRKEEIIIEVSNATLDYVFEELNFHKIFIHILAFNFRSINIYKKLGFQHVGTLRKHIFRCGKYRDYYIMDILKEEYLKQE